jgi:hypothetical protein
VKNVLGAAASARAVVTMDGLTVLREDGAAYNRIFKAENEALS